ncbi:murein biosynthesis integral membrane protein MurJ [Kineosporia succinea]|uniref:Peptidoglycan lipid II flippase n=1 Tax=Kineosporia succinea TaxID=84632 RepID=A0ABT9P6Q1_9ACTN|nr:lipid II flippase MurJ [Kineosporia succinea]MDP9828357.1 putative peptidoglycan lipid II flippase [Kineosporia succinea]
MTTPTAGGPPQEPTASSSMPAVQRGLLASAALIAVVTVVARVIGFGRWLAFSGGVGSNAVGAAYSTANLLPNVLYEVVAGGALAGAVVPLLAGPLARHDRADLNRIVSALIGWVLVVLVPMSVVLALLAGPLSKVLVEEGTPGQRELVARMVAVFAPQVALYGIGVVLTGVLTAQRRFFWPAAAPLFSSVVVIGAYLVFGALVTGDPTPQNLPGAAEAWLAWGTTAGVAVMTLPLLIPAYRTGIRIRPTLSFPPGVARRGLGLAAAGISALLAQQASLVVVLLLANHLGPEGDGTINVYQYAQAVYVLPYAVLAVPLATSAFPRLAEKASTGDDEGFAATAASSTRLVVLVSLFGTAVLGGTSVAVGEFFGAIDASGGSDALASMGSALFVMAWGLTGFALIAHIGRALYARERGRAAAVATSLGWLVVIAGSVIGALTTSVVTGLAWGNTAGMTVAGVLLVLALRRVAGPASTRGLARLVLLAGASAVVAAVAGREAGFVLLDGHSASVGRALPAGVLAAVVSAGVFGVLLAVLDRKNLGMLAGRIIRRNKP